MAGSQTRFADIPLRVLSPGRGAQIADGWSRASHVASEHVPGSNRTITFVLGSGPYEAEWRIECLADDYAALAEAVQTTATLVLPHGTQNAPGTVVDEFGDLYDHIAGVTLLGVSRETTHRTNRGMAVQANARFRVTG